MDCRIFRRQHLAFVDDTLPGIDLIQMERHRSECAACAQADAEVRRSLLLIRNNLPTIEPSPDFSARLARRLEAERARSATPVPLFRGSGMSSFVSVGAGMVALGVLAIAVVDTRPSLRDSDVARVEGVVVRPSEAPLGVNAMAATAAPPPAAPMVPAPTAFVASVSTGMAVWPALLMLEEAQSRYARPVTPLRPASYSPRQRAR